MPRQFRFSHAGIAGVIALAGIAGIGVIRYASAAGGGTPSSLVPITPCRLVDTRPGIDNVGNRNTPLAATETPTFQVTGTNGNCTIPSTATGIASNVTAVNPSANSYLTVYPADVTRPLSSNLNWTPTSPPTPNQVTVGLSATGAISTFNFAGNVDVVIDIVGYYTPAGTTGTTTTTTPQPTTHSITFSGYDIVGNFSGWVDPDPSKPQPYPNGCVSFGAVFKEGFLSLDVPDGATITSVKVLYLDISPLGSLALNLYHGEPGISAVQAAPSISSIGTNTSDFHRSEPFQLTSAPTVSGQSTYWVTALSVGNTTVPVDFCGAQVIYTLPAG